MAVKVILIFGIFYAPTLLFAGTLKVCLNHVVIPYIHFLSYFFVDMIAVLGETTGYFALRQMHRKMISDPVGQQILWLVYLG